MPNAKTAPIARPTLLLVKKSQLSKGALLLSPAAAIFSVVGKDAACWAEGACSVVAEGAASANVCVFGGEVPCGLMTLGSNVATVCSVLATTARVSVV